MNSHSKSSNYGHIAGVVDASGKLKPLSKIVMGTMLEGAGETDRFEHGFALFDDYFERGGNVFDTAFGYLGGDGERVLGRWMASRGVQGEVTVLVKGAHTPDCHPEGLTRQLHQSLERLGLECADLYLLHRDNPAIPVGDFIETLNEHRRAGRIRAFGGSNWSLERLQAANDYAKSRGLAGMTVASNNFSLARMVAPPWDDCVSSSDAASRAWFLENGLSLFSWSSQARGFFARGNPQFLEDGELARCWYAPDNFERLGRAQKLAREKSVSPVVIAAAWVLRQPFPVYALIGPRNSGETCDSMSAFAVELSTEELRWLNLEI